MCSLKLPQTKKEEGYLKEIGAEKKITRILENRLSKTKDKTYIDVWNEIKI